VGVVQRALSRRGHPVQTDDRFGQQTRAAVVAFQRERRLRDDGIVGPRTARALGLRDGFDAAPARRARPAPAPARQADVSDPTPPGAHPRALMTEAEEEGLDPVMAEAVRLNRASNRVSRALDAGVQPHPEDLAGLRAMINRNEAQYSLGEGDSPHRHHFNQQITHAREVLARAQRSR
jgi:hypothetical protein